MMNEAAVPAATTADAIERLREVIGRHTAMLIAYSGGVDSAVLLGIATEVLGERAIGVTADSPSLARRELREASIFAREIGARHLIVHTEEMSRDEYVRNDPQRCFFCKQTLFARCEQLAREMNVPAVAYGYNLDDTGDVRPGHRAASEFGVIAPLHEAGLGKKAVRAIAAERGWSLADKPAAPCLSSRIPYGSSVTVEKLSLIESTEDLLQSLGFQIFRARYDGSLMRIEVAEEELERLMQREVRSAVFDHARENGARIVTVDLEGFRSGKLNRLA